MPNANELPEPWYTALTDAGYVGPYGEPSLRKLAEGIDAHPSTVSRLIRGANAKGARPELVAKIADALGRKPEDVASWAGEQWQAGLGPYSVPSGAESLTLRQRESVDRVIRAFIEVNRRERSRRALDTKMVRQLAKATGKTRVEIADILEEIEGREE